MLTIFFMLPFFWVLSSSEMSQPHPTVPLEDPHPAAALKDPHPITNLKDPHIVIKKAARSLELFDGDHFVKKYETALGFAPVGDKQSVGDGKTPEGEFYIFVKNDHSKFYLSLGLSYPNAEDAKRGLENHLITQRQYQQIVEAITNNSMPPQNTKLGGDIYIHGGGVGNDWTWGCIALADADIKEIFDTVAVGTNVTILP